MCVFNLKMLLTFALCYCLLINPKVTVSLKLISVSIPSLKQRGESVTMTCDYDLQGGKLYSVKWYRDNEEFYRYMPRLKPPQHSHRIEGVRVDLEKSTARRVHLREITLKSRGLYRCEVSEEAPSFHSAQSEAFMEVFYFPRESPRITGHNRRYDINEDLDINCTSVKAFPAPELQWYINGEMVIEPTWLIYYNTTIAPQGLEISMLGLRAPARPHMKLRCVASIGTHRRERTVILEINSSHREKSFSLNVIFFITYIVYVFQKMT